MKKVLQFITILIITILCFYTNTVYSINENVSNNTESRLVEIKEKQKENLNEYDEKYNSNNSGLISYISNLFRIYSIPIWVILVSIVINFIPTFIAIKRKHSQKVTIILINIFLGWTLIGWVICLIWSCSEGKNKDDKYEKLEKLQKLKDNGTISEEEFKIEKEKLLNQ